MPPYDPGYRFTHVSDGGGFPAAIIECHSERSGTKRSEAEESVMRSFDSGLRLRSG